ncbi:DEDD exonuclease domain-containing protein [Rarobacter incanus]|uniref:DNA polymerase-3 subunit epsilon n=1 Tax=Rarobacter incanus TaxID=153494 RepID=A0A542SME6_9MICO|nr:DEDD exonuclease domain-containing protein [Rarobacter incanus]TQK75801.1 DNA polymerase-3 subunit epsilon [Rarobacter incanus]
MILAAHDSAQGVQATFDDFGEPLHQTTFVVVDLETTGSKPGSAAITEIGAVKVRGGEVIGEFQTLVDAGLDIPPFIRHLTGITPDMLVGQPGPGEVIASFIEFLGDAVIVAHNAPFDVGFLRHCATEHGYPWPRSLVVDTVKLARAVVPKGEVPNHKLSTLAQHFGARVTPDHRALSDARATVDVLHALLERHAARGVLYRDDLRTACDPIPEDVRRRHTLADNLTRGPGAYMFVGSDNRVLYVGKSTNVRTRVRSYFTAAEKRARMQEMTRLTVRVTDVPCATALEAEVRELRLIEQHSPPYNRRSKRQRSRSWISLSPGPNPRLVTRRRSPASDAAIGPLTTKQSSIVKEFLEFVYPIRTCTKTLPATPRPGATACVRLDMQQCPGPCVAYSPDHEDAVARVGSVLAGDVTEFVHRCTTRMRELSAAQRYEAAAYVRDGIDAVTHGVETALRLRDLRRRGALVLISRGAGDATALDLIVRGRHCASMLATGPHIEPAISALLATADRGYDQDSSAEEQLVIAAWIDRADVDVRQVHADDSLSPHRG